MEAALKIWDQLYERHGPWRALLFLIVAAIGTVFVLWLAQELLGVPIIPIIFNRTEDANVPTPPISSARK